MAPKWFGMLLWLIQPETALFPFNFALDSLSFLYDLVMVPEHVVLPHHLRLLWWRQLTLHVDAYLLQIIVFRETEQLPMIVLYLLNVKLNITRVSGLVRALIRLEINDFPYEPSEIWSSNTLWLGLIKVHSGRLISTLFTISLIMPVFGRWWRWLRLESNWIETSPSSIVKWTRSIPPVFDTAVHIFNGLCV